MAKSYASIVVPASAEDTWELVRDFGGLARWHPAVATCAVEDGRSASDVGCLRSVTLTDGNRVRERLRVVDDAERVCSYEFVESPFPVRSYLATMRVSPVTDSGQAFVEWFARYDADAADESGLDDTFSEGVFGSGLKGLARRLGD